MRLPVRIVSEPPGAAVVSVDGAVGDAGAAGAAGAATRGSGGLELSHWPGQRTPDDLRHDLSTGSALAFARLPAAEREHRARGCAAIVNNHYDTDGTCALFAVRHPERALPRGRGLLAAARSGDFFEVEGEHAFCVDATVVAYARTLEAADDVERWQAATDHWMEHLGALVDGDREPYRGLWEGPLEALRADRADLERAHRERVSRADATVWTCERGARSSRDGARAFDPGRHALFTAADTDRVLAVGPGPAGSSGPGGCTYRLVFSTRSWFDLVSQPRRPRPDLEALAAELDALEGVDLSDDAAWRTQRADSPSPELWFGTDEVSLYAEHNPGLRPSSLPPAEVTRRLWAACA